MFCREMDEKAEEDEEEVMKEVKARVERGLNSRSSGWEPEIMTARPRSPEQISRCRKLTHDASSQIAKQCTVFAANFNGRATLVLRTRVFVVSFAFRRLSAS